MGSALLALWITGPAASSGLAQTDPTAQATVDAAVQTLFAQTATAPLNMTETIAAAFSVAQTATAAAPIAATPSAPTQSVSVDALEVAEVIQLPLYAAPGRTDPPIWPRMAAASSILWIWRCVFSILPLSTIIFRRRLTRDPTETALDDLKNDPLHFENAACLALEDSPLRVDPETVRWSPDSRYLTMGEDFFRTLRIPTSGYWIPVP